MNMETTRFGKIEYNQEEVISFNNGIPGVHDYKKYILLPMDSEQETPFYFLQSVEEGSLSFLMLDTLTFYPDYQFELKDAEIEALEIEKPEDVLVLTMITAKGSLKEATTNLKAPIVINHKQKLAKQIVLEKEQYLIKQPLFANEHPPEEATKEGR